MLGFSIKQYIQIPNESNEMAFACVFFSFIFLNEVIAIDEEEAR